MAAAIAGAAWLWFREGEGDRHGGPRSPASEASAENVLTTEPFALPPVRPSRFRNTSLDVAYVGSDKCIACHADEHESYLRTAHSRALAEVDLASEPADAEFEHARSGRTYKVYRQDDQMRHRESIAGDDGLVLCDYPVRYTIGSGHHSRSYLVEAGGFLAESPITWYASKAAWGPSPGYDIEQPLGFERMADHGCLHCHAGRVEPVEDSRFRVQIHDLSIGCESCHGPGGLHVAHHQGQEPIASGEDLTIVHPARLPREQAEAICAQCHLRGAASVLLRGRRLTDFRPGLNLDDFRTEYVLEREDKSMTVVGHVEQMRLSRCYQQSAMTCTTCHDPHGTPSSEARLVYFRQKCLECHEPSSCGLEEQRRIEVDRQDNCVACHMPQRPTDIPHFAFTHHRIGRHEPESHEHAAEGGAGRLVPLYDIAHVPPIERSRSLGLAYLEAAEKQTGRAAFEAYRTRALQLLQGVRDDGLRDSDSEAALARLYWEQNDLDRAISFASGVLELDTSSGAATNALFVLGDSYLQLQQPEQALPALQRLVQARRFSEDWVLLGLCWRATGRLDRAIAALQQAAEISPARVEVHELLAQFCQAAGDQQSAQRHQQQAQLLKQRAATTR